MTWSMLIMVLAGIFLFLIFVALLADLNERIDRNPKAHCDWCGKDWALHDMQYQTQNDTWACPKCR